MVIIIATRKPRQVNQALIQIARVRKQAITPALPKLTPIEKARDVRSQSARKRWNRQVKAQASRAINQGRLMKSSFIETLEYDPTDGTAIAILNGKGYMYFNVPELVFNHWFEGMSTCITDDEKKKKRWWIGKTPSLGAFFNRNIKHRYQWVRI